MVTIRLSNNQIEAINQMQVEGAEGEDAVAILFVGNAHSGEGIYVGSSEYPEEGLMFLGKEA